MRATKTLALFLSIAAGLFAAPYQVTVDTSTLSGDYQVYFNLNGVTGNVATISGFNLGGGTALFPVVVGPGDLNSSVTLNINPPNPPFAEFAQNFTVGSQLSFTLDLTSNGPAGGNSPDAFGFALATTGNVNLPTTDPSGTDYLFFVELTGAPLNFEVFTVLGTGITPTITAVTIPEPSFGLLSAGLLMGMMGVRRFRFSA